MHLIYSVTGSGNFTPKSDTAWYSSGTVSGPFCTCNDIKHDAGTGSGSVVNANPFISFCHNYNNNHNYVNYINNSISTLHGPSLCGSMLQPVFGLFLSCSRLSSTQPGDSEKWNLTLCPFSAVECLSLMYWCMCKNNYHNYASQK